MKKEGVYGYKIKLHVYKTQVYYPDNSEGVYEHDEYRRLGLDGVLISSDMLRVIITEIIPGENGGAPSVLLYATKRSQGEYDKKAGDYVYSVQTGEIRLNPGESLRFDDTGQNCSDYYVQYSFDVSVCEGEYEDGDE